MVLKVWKGTQDEREVRKKEIDETEKIQHEKNVSGLKNDVLLVFQASRSLRFRGGILTRNAMHLLQQKKNIHDLSLIPIRVLIPQSCHWTPMFGRS